MSDKDACHKSFRATCTIGSAFSLTQESIGPEMMYRLRLFEIAWEQSREHYKNEHSKEVAEREAAWQRTTADLREKLYAAQQGVLSSDQRKLTSITTALAACDRCGDGAAQFCDKCVGAAEKAGRASMREEAVEMCEAEADLHDSCAESAREIKATDSLRVHACHANEARVLAAKIKELDA